MHSAVCVLIVNKQNLKFLSVSLKNDHTDFNLPGGKVELNETLEETAIREVKEETGIDILDLTFLHKDYDDNYEVHTYYTHNYTGYVNTKEKHVVKWLPIYDLTKSKKWTTYNTEIFNKYLNLK